MMRGPHVGRRLSGWNAALRVVLLAVAVSLVSAANSDQPGCGEEIVAAFDIGSGTTRMRVARYELCVDAPAQTLTRAAVPVPYAADLAESGSGEFSPELVQSAGAIMAELREQAESFGAEVLIGVATEAFRRADNGAALLQDWADQLGLEARVIDQHSEGRLAYGLVRSEQPDDQRRLVWDIGAGSQQLVWRDAEDGGFQHFNSDLASVTLRNAALAVLDRAEGVTTPNPIAPDELPALVDLVENWVHADWPGTLADLLGDEARLVGVGGVHGASIVGQLGVPAGSIIRREQLGEVLARQLGRGDAAIGGPYADTDVTNLILVHTLLGLLDVDEYQATRGDLAEALIAQCWMPERMDRVAPRGPDLLSEDCLHGL